MSMTTKVDRRCKLDPDRVLLIRGHRRNGATYKWLADAFGMSYCQIRNICKGAAWQNVKYRRSHRHSLCSVSGSGRSKSSGPTGS